MICKYCGVADDHLITCGEWRKEIDALRARIAELEAEVAQLSATTPMQLLRQRLALAEKVCEAAAVYDRLGEDWTPVIDALAAWREGK